MEYTDKEYCLEVKGDFACFTRPELKVERVSYDVITPSAARAIFEAILFKKYAMRWEITRIDVLNPIKWISIRRNEVGALASIRSKSVFIEEKRQQARRQGRQGGYSSRSGEGEYGGGNATVSGGYDAASTFDSHWTLPRRPDTAAKSASRSRYFFGLRVCTAPSTSRKQKMGNAIRPALRRI